MPTCPRMPLRQVGCCFPEASEGGPSGGSILIETLARACERADVPIRTNSRVSELVQDPAGAFIGAVVETAGRTARIRTRRGVICATGGFTQDPELRLWAWTTPMWVVVRPGRTPVTFSRSPATSAPIWPTSRSHSNSDHSSFESTGFFRPTSTPR
ncbi:FAD-binding protein [Rhodococcus opacus]|nr:FAD-binding protein [Rhodococcus opacus]